MKYSNLEWTIGELINLIESQKINLRPPYQRNFIWSSKDQKLLIDSIIRKSKFPQNPKRSVRFSGKRTKRSVQKRKAHNTQKAETKVL